MKKFYIASWVVLLSGVLLQFFRVPHTVFLLLSGISLQFIHVSILFYRQEAGKLAVSLSYLTLLCMWVYITGRLHMWFIVWFIFPVIVLLFIITIILHVFNRKKRVGWIVILGLFLALISGLSFMPTYRLYYAIHLHPLLHAKERGVDYRSWDQYSWLLNVNEKYGAALEANRMASLAADSVLKMKPDEIAQEFVKRIDQHKFQLEHKEWESYP